MTPSEEVAHSGSWLHPGLYPQTGLEWQRIGSFSGTGRFAVNSLVELTSTQLVLLDSS